MGLIKRLIDKFNLQDKQNTTFNKNIDELKQYTRQELDSATYEIMEVYRVTLTRKVKTKNMPEPKKEVKSILAIRVEDDLYMDIETGKYYRAKRNISDLDETNKYIASEMPFRYYACETLTDKCIDWSESLTAKQFRETVRLQKERYKHPMYDCKEWGINR